MKKFLSTKYSAGAFNVGMLLLRVGLGILLLSHGYDELIKFESLQQKFMNFMGLGSTVSLALVVFAEVLLFHFCNPGIIYETCRDSYYNRDAGGGHCGTQFPHIFRW